MWWSRITEGKNRTFYHYIVFYRASLHYSKYLLPRWQTCSVPYRSHTPQGLAFCSISLITILWLFTQLSNSHPYYVPKRGRGGTFEHFQGGHSWDSHQVSCLLTENGCRFIFLLLLFQFVYPDDYQENVFCGTVAMMEISRYWQTGRLDTNKNAVLRCIFSPGYRFCYKFDHTSDWINIRIFTLNIYEYF